MFSYLLLVIVFLLTGVFIVGRLKRPVNKELVDDQTECENLSGYLKGKTILEVFRHPDQRPGYFAIIEYYNFDTKEFVWFYNDGKYFNVINSCKDCRLIPLEINRYTLLELNSVSKETLSRWFNLNQVSKYGTGCPLPYCADTSTGLLTKEFYDKAMLFGGIESFLATKTGQSSGLVELFRFTDDSFSQLGEGTKGMLGRISELQETDPRMREFELIKEAITFWVNEFFSYSWPSNPYITRTYERGSPFFMDYDVFYDFEFSADKIAMNGVELDPSFVTDDIRKLFTENLALDRGYCCLYPVTQVAVERFSKLSIKVDSSKRVSKGIFGRSVYLRKQDEK